MTFIVQSLDTLLRYVLSVTFRGAVVLKIMDQKTLVSLLFFFFVNFSPALYYLNAWSRLGTLRFLYLSHLLYGMCVKIFIMNRYISKTYTTSKNSIDRQYTERGQL